MFSPPRQASLTLIFMAIWLIDGAQRSRNRAASLAAGAFVAGISCFADPYGLVFLPALFSFLLLCAMDAPSIQRARCLVAGALGASVGLVPAWLLTHSVHASHGVLRLRTAVIAHNLQLLGQTCLPYLLGTTAYSSSQPPLVQAWPAPGWFHALQLAGAGLLLSGIVFGGFSAAVRSLPVGVRRLATLGAIMLPVTLGAFAVSVMVMDRLSARYLVAIVLMAPFALAPALAFIGPRRFALLLAPYLLSSAVAGWLSYGDDIHGVRPVRHDSSTSDEARLHELLQEQGLSFGVADYWVAYRLTFLFGEEQVVVPWHEQLDRYSPYRRAFALRSRVAYIFDPWRSKEELAKREAAIRAGQTEFAPRFQSLRAGRYTVLVLQRDSHLG
jgi:hypothetical protein